jgi:hypothetical protein
MKSLSALTNKYSYRRLIATAILTTLFLSFFFFQGIQSQAQTQSLVPGNNSTIFINEIHYDNTGADVNEGVEIAGPAGTNLSGWQLVPYNGANGQTYTPITNLTGALTNQNGGYGTAFFAISGLQNGAPDGIALVNPSNVVVQFLSYEGSFTATNGIANGLTSTDIGVSQNGTEAVGTSLQLQGTGTMYGNFTWSSTSITSTYNLPNTGQTFIGGGTNLSINDVTQAEGNSGTTTFSFTVSLSQPAGAGGVTFDIATAAGTATAGSDYVTQSLTGQSISAGNSTFTFNVTVNGDTTTEPNETFFVNVTNVTGANITDGQGLGTISNDDVSLTSINQIQGSGSTSPLAGQLVTTSGIVTALLSNGFYIQNPDANVDADPNTSEGVFVFTSSAPPAEASVGNSVQVTGTITEFVTGGGPTTPPVTELNSPTVTLLSTGNPLPTPAILTIAETTSPSGTGNPLETLEEYEGMRVQVNSLTVVAPTEGTVNETNAISTSNGVFFGVVTGVPRPARQPGIEISKALPSGAPANVPRFDENPERLRVDSNAQTGSSVINVTTDAVVTNLIGVLDYRFDASAYTIYPDAAAPPTVTGNIAAVAVPTPTSTELTVSGFNLERFFDNVDDPVISDPVLTTTAFNNRLNKASLAIRNVLKTPDVLGVIEVEKLSVLQSLATKINNDAVAAGQPNPNYTAFLVEGNDVGGIDVGFLVKTARVTVVDVVQVGLTTTYINPNNGQSEILNDRPPLRLRATVLDAQSNPFAFTVYVNHLRSLNGIDDETPDGTGTAGGRVRAKRRAQAEFLANEVQSRQTSDPNERIIVLGDFNAFQVNDGYVDLIGTIKGAPTPSDQVVLSSSDLVNPNLVNVVESLPNPLVATNQAYSFIFDGNAQILDHILATQNLQSRVVRVHYGRLNADFPETFRNDSTRPERISDHDAPVVYIGLAGPTASAAEIGGRIANNSGRSTRNVLVRLLDLESGEVRYSVTNAGGRFRFADVMVGKTYVVTPYGKRYGFEPNSIVINHTEARDDVNFMALTR